MNYVQDPITVDLRASCTIHEAVARLMGWMRGPIYPESIEPTDQYKDSDFLTYRNITTDNLGGNLEIMREQARLKLVAAMDASDDFDDYYEEYVAVDRIDDLIKNVAFYLVEITDEAAKGKDSMLRVDQHTTDKSGIPHYTLKSVDLWARENYDLPLLDHPWSKPEVTEPSVNIEPELKTDAVVHDETVQKTEAVVQHEDGEVAAPRETDAVAQQADVVAVQSDQEATTARPSVPASSSIANQLMVANGINPAAKIASETITAHYSEDRDKKGGLGRASADSLYTTLAITVQAYAATLEELYQLDTSNPTVAEIRRKFIDDQGNPVTEILHKDYFDDKGKKKETQFIRPGNTPYISGIAIHLENIGKQINKRPNTPSDKWVPISCQMRKSIIIRITAAMPLLNQALSKS